MLSFVSVAILLMCLQQVQAMSNGAPICTIGGPAPQSTHLERGASVTQTGPITLGNFTVTVNGVDITNITSFEVNATVPVKVEVSANGLPIKGVLVIVSKPAVAVSGVFSLTTEEQALIKISDFCSPFLRDGVTHVSSVDKTKISTTMTFPEATSGLFFDVNVVAQNNATGSLYYHSQYAFNVVTPASAPGGGGSDCGLLGLGIFCPLTFCGFFGRLLFGQRDC